MSNINILFCNLDLITFCHIQNRYVEQFDLSFFSAIFSVFEDYFSFLYSVLSWTSNLSSFISNSSCFYTPNHSALSLADPNLSWNVICRGYSELQLWPHLYQIEQKDYVMYLKDIIPACTFQNSIWLFCKSVTLLIVFISGIHSDHIHHHCSFPAELLVSSLKSYEMFHPVFTHCEAHSEFSLSQAVRTLFSYLASSILIITLYFPL